MADKAIIIDFFGVISSEVAPHWFGKYFLDNETSVLKEKYVTPANKGDVSYNHLMEQLGALVGITVDNAKKEWENLVVIDENVVSWIREARKEYKIALLSDAPHDFLRPILRRYGLEELFDVIVISSEVKMTKKDKAIYQLTIDRLEVLAYEAMLVDDNPDNIRLGEGVGLHCQLYRQGDEIVFPFGFV